MREYTVRYKEKSEKTGKLVTKLSKFTNLRLARIQGRDKYRKGTFISLINKKGVVLPL